MLALFTIIGSHEIIGKVIDDSSSSPSIVIEHPLVIRPIQKGPNQWALDLFPHSLANPEGEHTFFKSAIVSRTEGISPDLEKAYIERTSSIILASALDQMERM